MLEPARAKIPPPVYRTQTVSGLARVRSENALAGVEYLAVHDEKEHQEGSRLTRYTLLGQDPVTVDWSKTGRSDDLEAIDGVDGHAGDFLAVEGSRYGGRTPRILLLHYDQGQATAEAAFPLPELPQEIEGLTTWEQDDGKVLVLLGGRGDPQTGEGRLHWATYDPKAVTLTFSPDGQAGEPVTAPLYLGQQERAVAELKFDRDGMLWASNCVDTADDGPFRSTIYRLGTLSGDPNAPVKLTLDHAVVVEGHKIEALEFTGDNDERFLFGTDNESAGGHLNTLLLKRSEILAGADRPQGPAVSLSKPLEPMRTDSP